MAKPVVIMASGGKPVVNVTGATPATPVDTLGVGITLVETLGVPMTLINLDGTAWDDDEELPDPPAFAALGTESGTNSAITPFAATVPAYANGDLVIVHAVIDHGVVTITTPVAGPNGETVVAVQANHAFTDSNTTVSVFYWIGVGAYAGGTMNIASSVAEQWAISVNKVAAGTFHATIPVQVVVALDGGLQETVTATPTITSALANGRPVFVCGLDSSPVSSIGAGWTEQGNQDPGATCVFVASRDTETTEGEVVASVAFTISSIEDWTGLCYIINGLQG
jgi:hypothetical protein